MTQETQYGIIKAKVIKQLPDIDLIRVPYQGRDLIAARFGPNSYSANVNEMRQPHRNLPRFPRLSFESATTAESISIASYDFEKLAKPEIFNQSWLQAGRIVRDSEGVYANPLTAIKQDEVDETELKKLRGKMKNVGGVWILENGEVEGVRDCGFTPYGFKEGEQTAQEFAEGRLARLLTHTQGKVASKLLSMAKTYKNGNGNSVNVIYFDKTNKPVSRVVELLSFVGLLLVDGVSWFDFDYGGYAFGVFEDADAESYLRIHPGQAAAQGKRHVGYYPK
jgi:hypothetical protein